MTARRSWFVVVSVLLIVIYVVLANNGLHHWHEFRDLYSATFYSTADLMGGAFDPGPAPVRTAEQVAGWYGTKLFHIYLLKEFVNLLGVGLKSYTIIKALYVAMLMLSVGLVGITLWTLGMSTSRTAVITGLFLLSPVTVYVGYKLLPEVPSLLFSAAALVLFIAAFRRSSRRIVLSSLAGLALTLSALSTWNVPLLFLGFWFAFLLVWLPRNERKSIAFVSFVTWTVFFVSMPIGLWLLGGSLGAYL